MRLTGRYSIPAPPERVYAALTDPVVLKTCIPGCEDLSLSGPDTYDARLKIGVAGLKGTYTGTARLSDLNPPEGYTLSVEGKGAPGFVRGSAAIRLTGATGGTDVACDADVQVGGLIAAVGSRLIEVAGRKMMNEFFECFTRRLTEPT